MPGARLKAHEAALHNVRQLQEEVGWYLSKLTDCLRDDHILRVIVDLSNVLGGSEGY